MDGDKFTFPHVFKIVMENHMDNMTIQEVYQLAREISELIGTYQGSLSYFTSRPRFSLETIQEMKKLEKQTIDKIKLIVHGSNNNNT